MAPPPSGAGALVGRRLGKYEILALIALGGTAEIYLARIGGEAGFEKYVVVKVLHDHLADDQEFVRMFLDEARLGAQLEHSNIVQTLELGQEEGRYFMVMEYLAGMSLAMVARKSQQRVQGGRIPVDLVLGLAAQACAGLHYMHEKTGSDGRPMNMVHRDISPQNLVISFEGMLKIVDFGIAKARVRETHTKSGTIKGKFAYMSPEQCLAQEVDRRTDIFAMGTLLHELLTGRRLFKRQSTYETYQAIIAGKVAPPSATNHELDPALDQAVMRALAYKKEERYKTAEELGEALVSLLHRRGKSVSAGDVSRFFDTYFDQEIAEHGQRMRELIEGRRQASEELTWNAPDLESDAAAQMPDELEQAGPRPTMSLHTNTSMDNADDEIEGEATRIELNPLERVQGMHAEELRKTGATPTVGGQNNDDSRRIQRGRRTPAPAGGRTLGFGSAAMRAPSAAMPPKRPPSAAMPPKRPPGAAQPAKPAAQSRAGTAKPNDRTLFGAAAPKLPHTPSSERPGGKHAAAGGQRKSTQQAHGGAPAPRAPQSAGPQMTAGAEDKTIMPGDLQMSGADVRAAAEQMAAQMSQPSGPPPGQHGGPPLGQRGGPPPGQRGGPPPGQRGGPPPGQRGGPPPGQHGGPPPGQHGGPPPGQQPTGPSGPNVPSRSAPQGKPEQSFIEVRTPTAFKTRAALVEDQSQSIPSGDMALLANERATKGKTSQAPILVVAFLVSAGVGLGITMLVGKLLM